jgi:protein ImuB
MTSLLDAPGVPDTRTSRSLALWFPSWPVTAWAQATGEDASAPVAVVAANQVTACSPAAASEGVAIGQRRREAQSRCPDLVVVPADEATSAREFELVVGCVERLSPGVQVLTPGCCVLAARGLASYLGSEAEAAETLLEAVVTGTGVVTGRAGVADGVFAAVQAAHLARGVRIVPPGESGAFLAPLPVSRLGDEQLTTLLPRLGVRTLGQFAALPSTAVAERFGSQGLRLQVLASGGDPNRVNGRTPPPELTTKLDFEPPLELAEQISFAAREGVEGFIAGLATAGLACTEVVIELTGELDEVVIRSWQTPFTFDVAAVLDRLRWQLQASAGSGLRSRVTGLRLTPATVDEQANHVTGLFGTGPDERVHHVLTRVQSMLGPDGVLTSRIGGGRWLAERQQLVAWGERPARSTPSRPPWPGMVPEPLPATVFAEPYPVALLTHTGTPVALNPRGALVGDPVTFAASGTTQPVIGWAGPWPVDERFWDDARHRRAARFQVVAGDGSAWLLLLDEHGWWAEGRYD